MPGWHSQLGVQLLVSAQLWSQGLQIKPQFEFHTQCRTCLGFSFLFSLFLLPAFSFSLSLSLCKINKPLKNSSESWYTEVCSFLKILFIYSWETEWGEGGRGRSRLLAGSLMRDSIPGFQVHTLGRRQALNHWATQGFPSIQKFIVLFLARSYFRMKS